MGGAFTTGGLYQRGGTGSAVNIKIGSRIYSLFFSPTDQAYTVLKHLGISPWETNPLTGLVRKFILRPLGTLKATFYARPTIKDAGQDIVDDPPQLEVVDMDDPTWDPPGIA